MTKARSNATAPNAKGTLVVGNGTDASTTLAVASTAGYVLTVDSAEATGLKWAALSAPSFVGCSLYGTGEINYSANTNTEVTWQNEEFDTDGFHSTSSNTGRITIPSGKAGKYLFNGQFEIDDNANSSRTIKLYKNGSEVKTATVYQVASVGRGTIAINVILDLAVSDYVQAYVFATASSYVNKTQIRSWLQAVYLGA